MGAMPFSRDCTPGPTAPRPPMSSMRGGLQPLQLVDNDIGKVTRIGEEQRALVEGGGRCGSECVGEVGSGCDVGDGNPGRVPLRHRDRRLVPRCPAQSGDPVGDRLDARLHARPRARRPEPLRRPSPVRGSARGRVKPIAIAADLSVRRCISVSFMVEHAFLPTHALSLAHARSSPDAPGRGVRTRRRYPSARDSRLTPSTSSIRWLRRNRARRLARPTG